MKWRVKVLVALLQGQSQGDAKDLLNSFPLPIHPETLDPEVIKLFSCSTQLSTKFQLLIKTKILTNEEVSCLKSLRCCIYHANNCLNEQDKFSVQLS